MSFLHKDFHLLGILRMYYHLLLCIFWLRVIDFLRLSVLFRLPLLIATSTSTLVILFSPSSRLFILTWLIWLSLSTFFIRKFPCLLLCFSLLGPFHSFLLHFHKGWKQLEYLGIEKGLSIDFESFTYQSGKENGKSVKLFFIDFNFVGESLTLLTVMTINHCFEPYFVFVFWDINRRCDVHHHDLCELTTPRVFAPFKGIARVLAFTATFIPLQLFSIFKAFHQWQWLRLFKCTIIEEVFYDFNLKAL